MAKNLRAKIPQSDTLIIHDVNPAVTEQFKSEIGNAEIAQSVREVAEKTVCQDQRLQHIAIVSKRTR